MQVIEAIELIDSHDCGGTRRSGRFEISDMIENAFALVKGLNLGPVHVLG